MGVKDFSLSPGKMFAWASGATSRFIGSSNQSKEAGPVLEGLVKSAKSGRRQAPLRKRGRPTRRTSVLVLSAFLLINIQLVTGQQQQHQHTGESSTVIKATRATLGERPNVSTSNNKMPKLAVRSNSQQDKQLHDLRWPNRQLNVLVDKRSLNDTEQAILASVFQQIEHKTCVHVHKLSPDRVNPFAMHNTNELNETEQHFIYVFKSPGRNGDLIFGRHPSMGLSSLGCVKQGRQSLVLTELAFKWPELVLRYHVMRSLGVDNLERPDGHIRRLLNMLPLNQKIANRELLATIETQPQQTKPATNPDSTPAPNLFERWSSAPFEQPILVAFASKQQPTAAAGDSEPARSQIENVQLDTLKNARALPHIGFLSEHDLGKIKELYDCKDYMNKLSPVPLDTNEINSEAESIRGTNEQLYGKQSAADVSKADASAANGELNPKRFKLNDEIGIHRPDKALSGPLEVTESEMKANDLSLGLSQEAAQRIVDSLLSNLNELKSGDKTDQLESESSPNKSSGECKPLDSCPLGDETNGTLRDGVTHYDEHGERQQQQERPMILKLDEYHAQDPQLKQANQMKLSQLSNDTLETYRLMNNPTNLADFLLPGPQLVDDHQRQIQHPEQSQADIFQNADHWQRPRSEMLISFEQSSKQHGDPVSALTSSQVLKLCSCTCQTMTPKAPATPSPVPVSPTTTTTTTTPVSVPTTVPETTPEPVIPQTTTSPAPTERPTFPTDPGPPKCDDYDGDYDENGCHSPATPTASSVTEPPPVTFSPSPSPEPVTLEPVTNPPTEVSTATTTTTTTTSTTTPAPTTTSTITTTQAPATTATPESVTPQTTMDETPASASITEAYTEIIPTSSADNSTLTTTSADSGALLTASACDLVEWVKPNKTIYNSPRIVWDADRGNQNYFLCNNQLNGELIPGKTHGFYCKISNEGKAFEVHNFSVLTKPEHVNLAWVQKNSNSFGRTNFPVVGGYSKQQDPYIVSRCLIKDENNDVITLIGYINNQGVGWFPFDDIQIECNQYDVLACVN